MGKVLLFSLTLMGIYFTNDSNVSGSKIDSTEVVEQTVLISEVEFDKGIYFYKKKIFNGNIVAYYANNEALKYKCEVFDGRLHGITKEYFENGDIKAERNYYLGKLFGKFTEYFENGEVYIKGDVKNINYHGGEEITDLSIATLKRGKAKAKKIVGAKIVFLKPSGEQFRSSEEIPIYLQNHYIITTLDGSKTFVEVK